MKLETVDHAIARGVPVTRCPRGAFGLGTVFAGDVAPRITKTASAESYRQRTQVRVAAHLKRKMNRVEYGSDLYRLLAYRLRTGKTTKEVALEAGVSHGAVTDFENHRGIAAKKLRKIMRVVEKG